MREAIAGFRDIEDASDAERDAAWARIVSAAHHHGVPIAGRGWRELPKRGTRR